MQLNHALLKDKRVMLLDGKQGKGLHGQLMLNTLFIKLDQPAKTINIDGLPENVVPITTGSKNVDAYFQVT